MYAAKRRIAGNLFLFSEVDYDILFAVAIEQQNKCHELPMAARDGDPHFNRVSAPSTV